MKDELRLNDDSWSLEMNRCKSKFTHTMEDVNIELA